MPKDTEQQAIRMPQSPKLHNQMLAEAKVSEGMPNACFEGLPLQPTQVQINRKKTYLKYYKKNYKDLKFMDKKGKETDTVKFDSTIGRCFAEDNRTGYFTP